MKIQEIAAATAISVAVAGSAGAGGKFYLDTQYVQVSEFQKALDEKEKRQLRREIRLLELNPDRSELEDYYLQALKDELAELE